MQFSSPRFIRAAAVVGLALTVGVAQAHTGHGTSGISEGLAHPLGADHLLAMVAVGIWSVSALPAGKAWLGPATFLLSLAISAALGAVGLQVPFLEQMVALSVVVCGAMLVLTRVRMPVAAGLGLVALAAALHGEWLWKLRAGLCGDDGCTAPWWRGRRSGYPSVLGAQGHLGHSRPGRAVQRWRRLPVQPALMPRGPRP